MASNPELDRRVETSTKVYDTSFLNVYDVFVHGFCNRYAWDCPTDTLVAQYDALTSDNHLEAGVGTGFLIDKASLDPSSQRLGILDFSKNCLSYSTKRLARYAPESLHQDILKPVTQPVKPFKSIGINYVLHCVPGSFETKGVAFAHLKTLLAPGGVLFGSTLLGRGVPRNRIARTLMAAYNRLGVFSNREDDVPLLHEALSASFTHVEIEVVGCCALFKAH